MARALDRVAQSGAQVAYVISLNLRRRHLDESQRAMVAAKLATLRRETISIRQLAKPPKQEPQSFRRSVERAAEVRDHEAPELVRAVEQAKVSVSAAATIASQSIKQQREILTLVEPKLILKAAQEINARKAEKPSGSLGWSPSVTTIRPFQAAAAIRLSTAIRLGVAQRARVAQTAKLKINTRP